MAGKTIRQEVFIGAKPGEVYEALVNPKKHAEFTGSGVSGTAKKGGKFTAGDGYIFGKNLELVKGKKIVQEWMTTEWPEGAAPSILEFKFSASKGGTKLSMKQTNVPPSQAADYAQGWKDFYWKPLRAYFKKK